MVGWIALLVLAVMAIVVNPWIWIAVGLFGTWKAYRLYFYYGRPWRRIHYPTMRAYARAAGSEFALAQRGEREFELNRALTLLLRMARPEWSDAVISHFIEREVERCRQCEDAKLIENELQRRYPKSGPERVSDAMKLMNLDFDPSDNSTMVRMIIAGLIEDKYGSQSRGEYIYELVMGNAK